MGSTRHIVVIAFLTLALTGCGKTAGGLASVDEALEVPAVEPFQAMHEPDVPPKALPSFGPPGATLAITSSLVGYVEPCGCTIDITLGGIDRLSGFVRSMGAIEPSLAVVDTGNMLFDRTEVPPGEQEQARRKARLLLSAHRAMGTVGTVPGPHDLALGLQTYRELLAESGVPILAANLQDAAGEPLGAPSIVVQLGAPSGNRSVALIGLVDPAYLTGRDDLRVLDPLHALAAELDELATAGSSPVVVVVAQGELAFARSVAEHAGVDFVLLGDDPGPSDAVTEVHGARMVEVFSQGRHVGLLKLFGPSGAPLENARAASYEDLARLDRRIEYLDSALDRVPPGAEQQSPFVLKKRQELAALEEERLALSAEQVEVPSSGGFAWFSVPMEPGYPLDRHVHDAKVAYNEGLAALYAAQKPQIEAPGEGQAGFASEQVCLSCHGEAHGVWASTAHAGALASLEARGRAFDPDCLRCHVTGYAQPGGAIVGNLGVLGGVQCEACHGAGSLHVAAPEAHELSAAVPAEVCGRCHDEENSPRFDYGLYLPKIVGPGHGG